MPYGSALFWELYRPAFGISRRSLVVLSVARLTLLYKTFCRTERACDVIKGVFCFTKVRCQRRRNESPPGVCDPHVWPTSSCPPTVLAPSRVWPSEIRVLGPKTFRATSTVKTGVCRSLVCATRHPSPPRANGLRATHIVGCMARDLSPPPRDAAPAREGLPTAVLRLTRALIAGRMASFADDAPSLHSPCAQRR